MASTTTGRRALIFHGYGATPEDHWFGWLAQRLEDDGIPVTAPALPDPLSPDPVAWEDAVRTALGTPDAGTIVVAHSLGCLAVLRALGSLAGPWRLGTLALVAGFLDPLPALPELDGFIADGAPVDRLAVAGLAEHLDRLVVLRSDRDEFVPTTHTDRLAALLGTEPQVVEGAGHFLADDGVTEAPAIHDAVRSSRL
ncbi:alpha/beta hydrolase [Arthrobacter sp. Y-9]|uniref:RBBP9/YdeN family alpha/beta hydrolase n=1 Tax=Arthrobacter sp. Y-9 TaxID=3039385 RepID=UPI00241FAF01|nr:alpha/beta hydrolase [Arthrobacter sp. Y-9]WFR84368.1 alpha/beta hydrolase [Arthrobacter sp. Y-9]